LDDINLLPKVPENSVIVDAERSISSTQRHFGSIHPWGDSEIFADFIVPILNPIEQSWHKLNRFAASLGISC
jgi:hypothetical protein